MKRRVTRDDLNDWLDNTGNRAAFRSGEISLEHAFEQTAKWLDARYQLAFAEGVALVMTLFGE